MNSVFSHNQILRSPSNLSPVRFCFIICTNKYLNVMQLHLHPINTISWHELWNKTFYRNVPSTLHIWPVLNIIKTIQKNLVLKNNLLDDSTSWGKVKSYLSHRIQHCADRFCFISQNCVGFNDLNEPYLYEINSNVVLKWERTHIPVER